MPELAILMVGDPSRDEFREAVEAMRAGARVTSIENIDAAILHLSQTAEPPALIVLAQRWPGEFSQAAVEHLQRLAPLARISGLLGSWCEGEARSGRPWPAAIRIYWHQWRARFAQETERLARGECPSWGLPVTARDEDRLLAASEAPLDKRDGLVIVLALRESTCANLVDACRLRGYSTVAMRPDRLASVAGAIAGLWDTTAEEAADTALVRRLRQSFHDAPLVALLDFPRAHHVAAARAAGVSAVVSKPFWLDDLFSTLDAVVGSLR